MTQLQQLQAETDIKTLIETKQLDKLKGALNQTSVNQVAELFDELEFKDRAILFRLLNKDMAIEVFEHLDPQQQTELVQGMENPDLVSLLEQLDPDDRVRLFEEFPAKVTKRLIGELSKEARESVNLLLNYPEESAGRVMSPRYQVVRSNTNVGDALEAVRASTLRADELRVVFVIDEKRFYQGYIPLAELVKADPKTPVKELVEEPDVFVRAYDNELEAAHMLKEQDLPAIPVTDSEGRVVGVVTFDDVIDLLEEEASESMYKKAGVGDLMKSKDEVYSQRLTQGSIWYPIRVRILFLIVTLVGGFLVGTVIDAFEETLEAIIAVAIFIPVIMDMGGNVGTQSTTIFARGLALGHIDLKRFLRYLRREGLIGLLMGAILGLVGGIVAYYWQGLPNDIPQLGVAVGLSLFIVIFIAALLGFFLPYILVKLGLDHAAGADPFLTTIKDFTGLLLYFALVAWLIGVPEVPIG